MHPEISSLLLIIDIENSEMFHSHLKVTNAPGKLLSLTNHKISLQNMSELSGHY